MISALPKAAVRALVDVDLTAQDRVVFRHLRSSREGAREFENVQVKVSYRRFEIMSIKFLFTSTYTEMRQAVEGV